MADTYFKALDHNVKLVDLGDGTYAQAIVLPTQSVLTVSIANAEFDSIVEALVVMEAEHHEIHEGDFYSIPLIVSITNGEAHNISILTNASKRIHFKPEKVSSSGEKISVALQEGFQKVGGTAATPINHNRASAKTSSVVVKTAITNTTAGVTLSIGYVGGGTGVGGSESGGQDGSANEFILKTATEYGIVVSNGGAGASTVAIALQWYEE